MTKAFLITCVFLYTLIAYEEESFLVRSLYAWEFRRYFQILENKVKNPQIGIVRRCIGDFLRAYFSNLIRFALLNQYEFGKLA